MSDMSEKLGQILRDANLKGAMVMVYQKAQEPGKPPILGWSMGLNRMSEQAAIANVLIALGEALIIDIKNTPEEKQPPNVDGITGSK